MGRMTAEKRNDMTDSLNAEPGHMEAEGAKDKEGIPSGEFQN